MQSMMTFTRESRKIKIVTFFSLCSISINMVALLHETLFVSVYMHFIIHSCIHAKALCTLSFIEAFRNAASMYQTIRIPGFNATLHLQCML